MPKLTITVQKFNSGSFVRKTTDGSASKSGFYARVVGTTVSGSVVNAVAWDDTARKLDREIATQMPDGGDIETLNLALEMTGEERMSRRKGQVIQEPLFHMDADNGYRLLSGPAQELHTARVSAAAALNEAANAELSGDLRRAKDVLQVFMTRFSHVATLATELEITDDHIASVAPAPTVMEVGKLPEVVDKPVVSESDSKQTSSIAPAAEVSPSAESFAPGMGPVDEGKPVEASALEPEVLKSPEETGAPISAPIVEHAASPVEGSVSVADLSVNFTPEMQTSAAPVIDVASIGLGLRRSGTSLPAAADDFAASSFLPAELPEVTAARELGVVAGGSSKPYMDFDSDEPEADASVEMEQAPVVPTPVAPAPPPRAVFPTFMRRTSLTPPRPHSDSSAATPSAPISGLTRSPTALLMGGRR